MAARLFPMLVLVTGCAFRQPFGLYDASRPIPPGARVSPEFVTAKACTPYLLGLIRLASPYGFPELVDEARGTHDGLVDITVDTTFIWWLFGTTQCHSLRARPVDFPSPIDAFVASGATSPVTPAVGTERERYGTADDHIDAGLAANAVVTLIYNDAGWRRDPTSPQWQADLAAVERWIRAGNSQVDALQQLREARKLHPDDSVSALVDSLPPYPTK